MASIRVEGIAEFNALCAKLGDTVGARTLRQIILKGAERFRDSVKAAALSDSDTGATVASVEAHLVRREDVAAGYATVNAKQAIEIRNRTLAARGRSVPTSRARYPFIVSTGSPAHRIESKSGKALLIAGNRFIKAVDHPGFTGSRFFARGVQSVRGAVKSQLEHDVRKEIVALANRYGVEVK